MAQGQILSIAQNTALFSLLGTTYGGNGTTTFQLPDLRGRYPNGAGNLLGGGSYTLGQVSGTESVTLLTTQIPQHNHTIKATSDTGDAALPQPPAGGASAYIAAADRVQSGISPDPFVNVYAPSGALTPLQTVLSPNGGSQPHTNMQPYLVINWCIALVGIFPSRN